MFCVQLLVRPGHLMPVQYLHHNLHCHLLYLIPAFYLIRCSNDPETSFFPTLADFPLSFLLLPIWSSILSLVPIQETGPSMIQAVT